MRNLIRTIVLGALVKASEKLQLDKDQDLYHQWEIVGRKLLRDDGVAS